MFTSSFQLKKSFVIGITSLVCVLGDLGGASMICEVGTVPPCILPSLEGKMIIS
jgi:hypothetical protein